jgi:hypothetical protein
MRRPHNISTFFILVALTTMVSCGQRQDRKQSDTSNETVTNEVTLKDSVVKNGNVTTTISTDINKLGQLLDFKTYKPTKVKFKYTFIDNSGQNQRVSVPGPSDYSLQAILYFDSLTFEKFLEYDRKANYPSPNCNKDEFKFDWLDKGIIEELNNSKENYHGHPNFFFGPTNSKAWYLDRKILISKWTN